MTVGDDISLDVRTASKLATHCQLIDVAFIELSAAYVGAPKASELSWDLTRVPATWVRPDDRQLMVLLPFKLSVRSGPSGDEQEFAVFTVHTKVTYALRGEVSDEDLVHFAGVSGFMHAWPYVRAEIQGLTTKLGLPPLTLPVIVSGSVPERVQIGSPLRGFESTHDPNQARTPKKKRSHPSRKKKVAKKK